MVPLSNCAGTGKFCDQVSARVLASIFQSSTPSRYPWSTAPCTPRQGRRCSTPCPWQTPRSRSRARGWRTLSSHSRIRNWSGTGSRRGGGGWRNKQRSRQRSRLRNGLRNKQSIYQPRWGGQEDKERPGGRMTFQGWGDKSWVERGDTATGHGDQNLSENTLVMSSVSS